MRHWSALVLALAMAACSNQLSGDRGPDGGSRGVDGGGFIDPDDGENGQPDDDGMGGDPEGDEGRAGPGNEPSDVEITLAAEIGVGDTIEADLVARSSAGDEVEIPDSMIPEWSSDRPDVATVAPSASGASVQGVAPGIAIVSVQVGTLTAMAEVAVVGGARESYDGEDCSDFAVAGKDVWACAVVSAAQPDLEGQTVLQVCRNGAWVNAALMTQAECDSCGYDGIVTGPGALCSEAPACAVDYYCN